ncbi:MAG: SGNH/GDSL hydrolase family protein, partial [Victivallales bacterium]|nr:SGNH/GDSL hydrolase family protein [Victivallales bacterium]
IWNRFQQLEAHASGKAEQEPRGYCDKCRAEMNGKGDQEQPCRVRGCRNTWTWTKRMQMESKDGKPPRRMCASCFDTMNTLEDKELSCRIKGCSGKVTWSKLQQLEYLRSGKKLENPPARMCDSCMNKFASLKAREEPCRMRGCKKTWTCTPYDQLEVLVKTPEGQEPVMPKRMCPDCLKFFLAAQDKEEPCSNRGCDGKWTWSRAMQLGAHINGHGKAPRRMCDACQKKLTEIQPKEMPCVESACKGTWTYRPEDQLKDELQHRQPEARHCNACSEFLKNHQAEILKCEKCGGDITWSAQEQLLTTLGTFSKPRLCASCNAGDLAAMPPPEQVITKAPEKLWNVEIPVGGPWNDSRIISQRPEGMTRELIERMENSAHRIVCLGDDFTEGGEWVALLAQKLEEKQPGTVVLNAGLKECTTALAVNRAARDAAPFGPEAVIFSFAFADTRRTPDMSSDNGLNDALVALNADFTALVAELRKISTSPRLFCWMPNPIYPQKGSNEAWRGNPEPDEDAVRFYDSLLRNLRSWCQKEGVTVVDCKAMFEMMGQKSAMNWMESWCRPNADGARNIANWILEALNH